MFREIKGRKQAIDADQTAWRQPDAGVVPRHPTIGSEFTERFSESLYQVDPEFAIEILAADGAELELKHELTDHLFF